MGTQLIIFAGGGSLVDVDATLFIQLGVFLITLAALRRLLFRPAISLIEARREATEGALEAARALDEEVNRLNEEMKLKLEETRSRAGAERERMVEAARLNEIEAIRRARAEAHEIVARMRVKNEILADTARKKLAEDIEPIASMVASMALNRRV